MDYDKINQLLDEIKNKIDNDEQKTIPEFFGLHSSAISALIYIIKLLIHEQKEK